MFVRALIGIRDIDKGGVKEEEFSEVLLLVHTTCILCIIILFICTVFMYL